MKKLIIAYGFLISILSYAQFVYQPVQNSQSEEYKIKKQIFIDELLSKMTLDEKIGQLNLPTSGDFVTGEAKSSDIAEKIKKGQVGGLFNIKGVNKIREIQRIAVEDSHLKIPLIFGMDVIHGYETTFPIPLGLSASWDMDIIQKAARISAQEASADGINWTFSPMVDLSKDPRWGRVSEGSTEDPYLSSQVAKAMVYGYQGKDLSLNNTIMACVKHYALYGASEAGLDYNTVDMSRIRMFNEYFPPYKAAIDAGAGSVMASFNEIDGIPATGNKWLLDEILRKKWGFNGFVVSDYTGISEMIDHGMGDLQAVSALAMNAGLDMDMVSEGYLLTLKKSIDEGKVSEKQIIESARRILEAKYDLGLFEDPYKYTDVKRAKKEIYSKKHREEARKIASQTMVLLKNDKQILPLKSYKTIAVIGPLANNNENMTGTWSVASRHSEAISLLTGLKETIKNINFIYAKGSNVFYDKKMEERATVFGKTANRDPRPSEILIKEAVETAKKADAVILTIGETAEMSGESSSRTDIRIPKAQRDLLSEIKKTGKPIVIVLFTGRPLVIDDEVKQADAVLNAWFAGSEAGYAIADVLFGKVNPSGKLSMTFPRNVGQIPIYYNQKNSGRPLNEENTEKCEFVKFKRNYLDECNTPLFPFGYGLSYTSFNYSDISLNKTELVGNEELTVSITLTNTGKYDGSEVVQLYIRDLVGTVARPVKELKGFQKIFLKSGKSKEIVFKISPEDLKFYNSDLKYDWEAGEFDIMIGTNSRDLIKKRIIWSK